MFNRNRSCRQGWPAALIGLMLVGLLAIVPACGDDDDGGGGGGTPTTHQQVLESGMRGLAQFGNEAVSMEETAVVIALSESLPDLFPAARTVAAEILYAPTATDAARAILSLAPRLVERPQAMTKAGIEDLFGVYVCDPNEPADPADPLPGWVKIEEMPTPLNSVILRFDTVCGVVYYDHQGNMKTATGEIRLLDVVVDAGVPEDPSDDIPTQFIAEIAAGPAGAAMPRNQPKIVRATWTATIDAQSRGLTSLTIGDPEANTPLHPGASFVGPILFHATVNADPTSIEAIFGLYDTINNYAINFGTTIVGTTDAMESLTLAFGFGQTNVPSDPPFLFEVTASNFQSGGTELPLADVSGAISHNGSDLAVFEGTTAFVPVEIDVNGDEVVDENDTCPDIDVTFTDTQDTGNICLYMDQLVLLIESLPVGPAKAVLR